DAVLREEGGEWTIQGDPTEAAFLVAEAKVEGLPAARRARFERVGEIPFTSERRLMTTLQLDAERENAIAVVTKGAPDVLLARCTEERVGRARRPLTPQRRAEIARAVDDLGAAALRTLAIAYRPLDSGSAAGEDLERDLVLLGVIGMIDPPRPEARSAVARAKRAGVRPILITGDHPRTASAIAVELGVVERGARTVVGAELDAMDDDRLREVVRDAPVFARVAPEHKLRIVRALRANGEITAMTGDGVNDAPALKAADIGVAMGMAGTDVARGAADMVLMDDDFASIVAAVEEGRSIFANIQRFLRYLLSSNTGEVLVMFLGVVLAGTIGLVAGEGANVVTPLLATQILWINLLTDSGPALALGVEPADPAVMERPPRDPRTPVISRRAWLDIVLVGLVMAVGTLAVMDWALPGGLLAGGEAPGNALRRARTLGFTTLVFFQLFHTLNARHEDRSAFHALFANRWLWLAIATSAGLQVAVVHVPPLQRAFGTAALGGRDWLVCIAVASAVVWASELRKLVARVRTGPRR
ncbi:MAG TPA: HAD-IC family P-type ATPase, partial [Anaeromyxobacter sp.]|nr:HAD-IC family P-type ATPase [Anaeromyxobacter sp.]